MSNVIPENYFVNPERILEILDTSFPDFKYRPNQLEAIMTCVHYIFNLKKRNIILLAGTGTGKSHIAHKVATVFNTLMREIPVPESMRDSRKPLHESVIITKTIGLQNQYLNDFDDIAKLMSAKNYACHTDIPVPYLPSDKHHVSCRYMKGSGLCQYHKNRVRYHTSSIKCLNYAFFFEGLSQYSTRGLLIADEAHNFEMSVLNTLETTICPIEIRRVFEREVSINIASELGISDEEFDNSKGFSADQYNTIYLLANRKKYYFDKLIEEEEDKARYSSVNIEQVIKKTIEPLVKSRDRFKSICSSLEFIRELVPEEWFIKYDEENKSIYYKPVIIPVKYKKLLLNRSICNLFMSATGERIKDSLKLTDNEVAVVDCGYPFKLEHRPLFAFTNLPNLNKSSFDSVFPDYVRTVDELVGKFPEDTNCIIHSVSYKNANKIKELSKYHSRIFVPTPEQVRDLKEYIKPGHIVVSPSITEGVDLGDGLARLNIFIKVPYQFLGDEWIVTKKDNDEGWYAYTAMLDIIQGVGRGIRSADDKAAAFILDPSFKRLLNMTRKYVPDWFCKTIRWL